MARRKKQKQKPQVTVMEAKASHMPAVMSMAKEFFEVSAGPHFGVDYDEQHMRGVVDNIMATDGFTILVAENGKGPVGMVALLSFPSPLHPAVTQVQELAWWVAPAERKKGTGKCLLKAAEDWSRERGARALHMMSPKGSPFVAQNLLNGGFRLLEATYEKVL